MIANGFDTQHLSPDAVARPTKKSEWDVAEHERLAGLAARLDSIKDAPMFSEAAGLVPRERLDVRLVHAEDVPPAYRRDLVSPVRELGLEQRLIWADAEIDVQAAYNALDVLALSSYGEGLLNVLAEAMACVVSCVETDVGDAAWIPSEPGIVALPMDPQVLAQGLVFTLDRLPAERGSASARTRSRIEREYKSDVCVARTSAALEGLPFAGRGFPAPAWGDPAPTRCAKG